MLQFTEQFAPFEPEIPVLWTVPVRAMDVKAVAADAEKSLEAELMPTKEKLLDKVKKTFYYEKSA